MILDKISNKMNILLEGVKLGLRRNYYYNHCASHGNYYYGNDDYSFA